MGGVDSSDDGLLSLRQRLIYALYLSQALYLLGAILFASWVFVAGWFYSESGTDQTIAEMSGTESVFGIDPIPFLAVHGVVTVVVFYLGYRLTVYVDDSLSSATE